MPANQSISWRSRRASGVFGADMSLKNIAGLPILLHAIGAGKGARSNRLPNLLENLLGARGGRFATRLGGGRIRFRLALPLTLQPLGQTQVYIGGEQAGFDSQRF